MTLAESLLPEFDQEMASTRKVLERMPDDKLGWKAHPRSNSIGWVGSHLVEIPGWVEGVLKEPTWESHPPGGEPYRTPVLRSRQEMLEAFDRHVAAARRALESTPDEEIVKEWSLLEQGKPIITMPRIGVMRTFILNHTIHHRAFLCAYYRLNDIPVPGLYGPSGDEQ
ncbi:MAG: DinB family protein [Planctomyces sp.]|nr:DinB family protein [Planctomyces sp.]